MKISKIASICKKTARIHICTDEINNIQFIGDDSSLYLLHQMPFLDDENILSVFDVPLTEGIRELYEISSYDINDSSYNLKDTDAEEVPITFFPCTIKAGKKEIVAFRYLEEQNEKIAFLDGKYLSPLSDIVSDNLYFYKRQYKNKSYIACKEGLFLKAVMYFSKLDIAVYDFLKNIGEYLCRQI